MTLDTMSDLTRDILELADNDITDKVRGHLSKKLTANLSHPSGYTLSYLRAATVFTCYIRCHMEEGTCIDRY